jgi:hypothetical protein
VLCGFDDAGEIFHLDESLNVPFVLKWNHEQIGDLVLWKFAEKRNIRPVRRSRNSGGPRIDRGSPELGPEFHTAPKPSE